MDATFNIFRIVKSFVYIYIFFLYLDYNDSKTLHGEASI